MANERVARIKKHAHANFLTGLVSHSNNVVRRTRVFGNAVNAILPPVLSVSWGSA